VLVCDAKLTTTCVGQLVMNCKNTVFDFKRLIGRKFSDPDAQIELKRLLCKSRELDDGSIGLEVCPLIAFRGI
jgi:molecular chaperone DnaK (HSP70)